MLGQRLRVTGAETSPEALKECVVLASHPACLPMSFSTLQPGLDLFSSSLWQPGHLLSLPGEATTSTPHILPSQKEGRAQESTPGPRCVNLPLGPLQDALGSCLSQCF